MSTRSKDTKCRNSMRYSMGMRVLQYVLNDSNTAIYSCIYVHEQGNYFWIEFCQEAAQYVVAWSCCGAELLSNILSVTERMKTRAQHVAHMYTNSCVKVKFSHSLVLVLNFNCLWQHTCVHTCMCKVTLIASFSWKSLWLPSSHWDPSPDFTKGSVRDNHNSSGSPADLCSVIHGCQHMYSCVSDHWTQACFCVVCWISKQLGSFKTVPCKLQHHIWRLKHKLSSARAISTSLLPFTSATDTNS